MEETKTHTQDVVLNQLPEYKLRRRMRLSKKNHKTRMKLKAQVISHYGGRCFYCHETDLRVLCIDHINNDGAEHRRQLGNKGSSIYKWLKRSGFPKGFQVLCANHNWEKELERRKEKQLSEKKEIIASRKSKELARLNVLRYYSNGTPKCAECGESNINLLTLYNAEIKNESDSHLVNLIKNNNYSEGYTVLCLNCSMKKRINL